MRGKTKKATFNLNPDVLAELDRAMEKGVASSKNALVERALVKELDELKSGARKGRWEESAGGTARFMDICQVEVAFKSQMPEL